MFPGGQVLYGADYCGQSVDVWAAGVSLYVLLTGGGGAPQCIPPRQRLALSCPQQGVRLPTVITCTARRHRLGRGPAARCRYRAQTVPTEAALSADDGVGSSWLAR